MLLRLAGGLVLTVVVVAVLFVIAMRTKNATLQKPIKAMNKNFCEVTARMMSLKVIS